MDNTIIQENQELLPFGKGALVLQKRVRTYDEYGPLPVLESKALYYRTPSGEPIPVKQIQDIHNIAHVYHIDIAQAISKAPVALACLIADYEDLGTVLIPSWRYDIFQTRYGIDLVSNQPRLEGSIFRFLVVDLDIQHTPFTVRDVYIDISTMQIQKIDLTKI